VSSEGQNNLCLSTSTGLEGHNENRCVVLPYKQRITHTGCCIGSSVRWKSEGLQDRLLNCCSSVTESYKGFPMDGALVCAVSHYPIKLL
jgi:hypothetical protein